MSLEAFPGAFAIHRARDALRTFLTFIQGDNVRDKPGPQFLSLYQILRGIEGASPPFSAFPGTIALRWLSDPASRAGPCDQQGLAEVTVCYL